MTRLHPIVNLSIYLYLVVYRPQSVHFNTLHWIMAQIDLLQGKTLQIEDLCVLPYNRWQIYDLPCFINISAQMYVKKEESD